MQGWEYHPAPLQSHVLSASPPALPPSPTPTSPEQPARRPAPPLFHLLGSSGLAPRALLQTPLTPLDDGLGQAGIVSRPVQRLSKIAQHQMQRNWRLPIRLGKAAGSCILHVPRMSESLGGLVARQVHS